jgi:hypothetical protein
MSGFVCGMRKFDKHKTFAADRPSNPALYQENQKSLSDLMKQREQQDKGSFTPIQATPILSTNDMPTIYTPWKTPSTN